MVRKTYGVTSFFGDFLVIISTKFGNNIFNSVAGVFRKKLDGRIVIISPVFFKQEYKNGSKL